MEEILTGPVPRAFDRSSPPTGVKAGDLHRLRRYDSLAAMSSRQVSMHHGPRRCST